jgi:hypothetical protein
MLNDARVFLVQTRMECYMNYYITFIICASLPSMCPQSLRIICCDRKEIEENDLATKLTDWQQLC